MTARPNIDIKIVADCPTAKAFRDFLTVQNLRGESGFTKRDLRNYFESILFAWMAQGVAFDDEFFERTVNASEEFFKPLTSGSKLRLSNQCQLVARALLGAICNAALKEDLERIFKEVFK